MAFNSSQGGKKTQDFDPTSPSNSNSQASIEIKEDVNSPPRLMNIVKGRAKNKLTVAVVSSGSDEDTMSKDEEEGSD
jgi:hypothetical protein